MNGIEEYLRRKGRRSVVLGEVAAVLQDLRWSMSISPSETKLILLPAVRRVGGKLECWAIGFDNLCRPISQETVTLDGAIPKGYFILTVPVSKRR